MIFKAPKGTRNGWDPTTKSKNSASHLRYLDEQAALPKKKRDVAPEPPAKFNFDDVQWNNGRSE